MQFCSNKKFRLFLISLLFSVAFFSFTKKANAQENLPIIFSEIYLGSTNDSKWIELYNPSTDSFLFADDWFVCDENNNFKVSLKGKTIEGLSYLVLKDENLDFNLTSGNRIILKNKEEVIDSITLSSDILNSDLTDKSLVRQNLTKEETFIVAQKPSPGIPNRVSYEDCIIISQIYPHPKEDEDEFIKIHNKCSFEVNLSYWQLDDIETGGAEPFTIKKTFIDSEKDLFFYKKDTKIGLNDDGDKAILIDPTGNVKSAISYSNSKIGEIIIANSKENNGEDSTQSNNIAHSIKEAKSLNDDSTVTVKGKITVLPGVLSGQYFYIQDSESGIQVYSSKKDFPSLSLGEEIIVTGTLSQVSGERRIKINSSENIIKTNVKEEKILPQEIPISQICEEKEGAYIKVKGIVSKTSGNVFYISSNNNTIKIDIRSSTKIKKPPMKKGQEVEVCGILSQYKNEYRILPTRQEDVIITRGEESSLPETGSEVIFYPLTSAFVLMLWNLYQKISQKLAL